MLAAALFGTRRVSARQGWAGEKAGLFELPAWCVQVFQGCRRVKSQHAKRVYSQPARESWPSRVTHGTVQRTAVGSQNVPLDHIVADQGSYRFPESDPEREALVAMEEHRDPGVLEVLQVRSVVDVAVGVHVRPPHGHLVDEPRHAVSPG